MLKNSIDLKEMGPGPPLHRRARLFFQFYPYIYTTLRRTAAAAAHGKIRGHEKKDGVAEKKKKIRKN